jgi:uncharacterized protein (DUF1778 family)
MKDDRTERLFVRVTPAEKQQLSTAAQDSAETLSNWIRRTLVAAAKRASRRGKE